MKLLSEKQVEVTPMPTLNRKDRKKLKELLRRIRAAVQAGKWKKADWLVEQFLRSFEARRLAVRLAYRAMPRNLRPDKSELDAIALKLNAWAVSKEEVFVDIKPKASDPNEYRHIMDFGIENRARQYLVVLALRARVHLHPSQYGLRGHHEALKAVCNAMSEGCLWAIEYDIKDCYPSFNGKELANWLPLPEKVSEEVLLSEHLYLRGGPTLSYLFGCEGDDDWFPDLSNDELAKARRGIPQGSAASPFVAEALLASAIYSIPKVGVVVAYADNILLLATSKDDVVAMSKALWSALKAHPVGPFQPKLKRFDAGQPIEFLGHVLTLKNGLVRIDPSARNWEKFAARATTLIARAKKPSPSLHVHANRIEEAKEYVRSWTASFKLCKGIESLRGQWLGKIPVA